MGDRANIRDRVPAEEWETFRRCRFIQKTFRPYPCLATPLNEEGGTFYAPYCGQSYDPNVYELIEGAWDHEHCNVCNTRIEDGDTYWTNDGPEHVDLCRSCYPHVQQELRSE
jgi:hypothetical protein